MYSIIRYFKKKQNKQSLKIAEKFTKKICEKIKDIVVRPPVYLLYTVSPVFINLDLFCTRDKME